MAKQKGTRPWYMDEKYAIKGVVTLIGLVAFIGTGGDVSWIFGALAPWGSDGFKAFTAMKGAGKTMVVFALLAGATSCASLPQGFILDSRDAIQIQGEAYLAGCRSVTVAPEVVVDISGKPTFSGGVLVGCGDSGELAEFRCEYQTVEGKRALYCAPLTRWYSDVQDGD